jgi:hypothetical protein
MTTTTELFYELLDAGSITVPLTKQQARTLRTKLYAERKEFKENADAGLKAKLEEAITLHYDDDAGYATYELTKKMAPEYVLIKSGKDS